MESENQPSKDEESEFIKYYIDESRAGYLCLITLIADYFKNNRLTHIEELKELKAIHDSGSLEDVDLTKIYSILALFVTDLKHVGKNMETAAPILGGVSIGISKLISELMACKTNEQLKESFLNTKTIGRLIQDILDLVEPKILSYKKIEDVSVRASTRAANEINKLIKKEGTLKNAEKTLGFENEILEQPTIDVISNNFNVDIVLLEEQMRSDGWTELDL